MQRKADRRPRAPVGNFEDCLFTVGQASEMFGLSERSVWRLIKEQKLGHVRPSNRTVRITGHEIKAFIEKNAVKPI